MFTGGLNTPLQVRKGFLEKEDPGGFYRKGKKYGRGFE